MIELYIFYDIDSIKKVYLIKKSPKGFFKNPAIKVYNFLSIIVESYVIKYLDGIRCVACLKKQIFLSENFICSLIKRKL